MKIEFFKHNLNEEDKKSVLNVLNSLFLTTGQVSKELEAKLSEYLGISHTVTVASCTNALELSLRYYGIGPGDEVITTPMSFIATANAVEYVGATPVFVDVEKGTGNIDADLVEAFITSKTKAILPVHLYGQMCDMKKLRQIADKRNLRIIEDAAHCIEGIRDGVRVGELGDAACLSFYATKNITSGEGGAVVCHDKEMYEWLLRARLHGMSKGAVSRYSKKYEHYDMDFLGFKCNLTDIQSSLLIHQLERIEDIRLARNQIASLFDIGLKENQAISKPVVLGNGIHARHLYTIWVDPAQRDEIMHKLQDEGIGVAVNFRPIHLMSYYEKKYDYVRGTFPNCEKIGDSTITLPLYPKLTSEEIENIIQAVNAITQ